MDTHRDDSFYRGRSPAYDRPRRNNRSRSPPPVDRYEPRRNRGDDYRDGRRRITSPPANIDRYVPGDDAQLSAPPQPLVNPVPDPIKLPYQVGFSYFGEWWRANEKVKDDQERQRTGKRREPERPRGTQEAQEFRDKEKAKIQAAYDSYKEDLQAKMAKTFVQQHKEEQWFRERYVSEIRDPLRKQLNEYRRGQYTQWEQDLESGTFDDFTLEGILKGDSNGAGGAAEKEEGETTAANEVLGVGDLVPATQTDLKDEALSQPTLLIKTIAPSVSRQNLEAFCKEHLGADEGGFKWLSLSDPNPSKRYHRIGWIMLHPSAEISVNDRIEKEDGDIDEKEGESKKAAPMTTAEKALEAINGKTVKDEARGDFTCHVGVHNPPINPRKKALWDLFSAPERVEKDLDLAQKLVNKYEEDFGSDFNAILKIEEKVDDLKTAGQLKSVIPVTTTSTKERKPRALSMDVAMDDGEELEDGEEDEDDGMIDDDEVDDEDLLVKKKQLDLMVEYLRRVFNFCFFCVFESDSVHELTRKCPGGHLRRPRSSLTSTAKAVAHASALGEPYPSKQQDPAELEEGEAPEPDRKFRGNVSKSEQQLQRAFNWVRTFEDKIKQILDPESVDLRKLGGKSVDEGLADELAKFVKQEDEHKWRCKVPDCSKLFKEQHFWSKHIEKRHPEWLQKVKDEFNLVIAYVLDPSRIAPSRTDANSNGHFPTGTGPSHAGTPRGFNLQNYGMNNSFMGMNGFPPMQGFPPMFSSGGMPSVGGWNQNGGGDDRNGGPIRRGGGPSGRMGNNRSGPYDRNGGAMPMNGGRNRGSGPGAAGGGRWGDGAGGGAAVGPREAIQGRTLKSYEDLDQVSGAGGGELNY